MKTRIAMTSLIVAAAGLALAGCKDRSEQPGGTPPQPSDKAPGAPGPDNQVGSSPRTGTTPTDRRDNPPPSQPDPESPSPPRGS